MDAIHRWAVALQGIESGFSVHEEVSQTGTRPAQRPKRASQSLPHPFILHLTRRWDTSTRSDGCSSYSIASVSVEGSITPHCKCREVLRVVHAKAGEFAAFSVELSACVHPRSRTARASDTLHTDTDTMTATNNQHQIVDSS